VALWRLILVRRCYIRCLRLLPLSMRTAGWLQPAEPAEAAFGAGASSPSLIFVPSCFFLTYTCVADAQRMPCDALAYACCMRRL
jgi:hypothetical protein